MLRFHHFQLLVINWLLEIYLSICHLVILCSCFFSNYNVVTKKPGFHNMLLTTTLKYSQINYEKSLSLVILA